MQNEPLNTAPIQQFIQQVKNADLSKSREVKLDIVQAKNLAYTLGIVMARLEGDLEKFVKAAGGGANEVIEVKLDGGGNWK
jgi:hypothetical protein